MVREQKSLAVVWKNVRKMRSREIQSKIMDWIERSNCVVCAVNETGLTGDKYVEVSYGYSWFAANREWKGMSAQLTILCSQNVLGTMLSER